MAVSRLVDGDPTGHCFESVERELAQPSAGDLRTARDAAPGWVSEAEFAGTARELGEALAPLGGRVVSTEASGNVWVIQDDGSGPVAAQWVATELPGYGAFWQKANSIREVVC